MMPVHIHICVCIHLYMNTYASVCIHIYIYIYAKDADLSGLAAVHRTALSHGLEEVARPGPQGPQHCCAAGAYSILK